MQNNNSVSEYCQGAGKAVEYEHDNYTRYIWFAWNGPQRFGK